MIERVYIDNFRSFSSFEVRLGRVNLLLGLNGSGKSSFMDVIAGIAENLGSGAEVGQIFSAADLTRWDSRIEQRFELDVRLDDALFEYSLRVRHDGDDKRAALVEEIVERNGQVLFAYRDGQVHLHGNDGTEGAHFPFRSARSFLPEVEARRENTELFRFLEHVRGIRELKLIPTLIDSVTADEDPLLRSTGENFASWYRHLAQERSGELHELFEGIRRAIPDFRSLALVGAGKQGRSRDLVVRFDSAAGGQYELEFQALSDGQRALVVLYTLLVEQRSAPRMLMLDEPENFVGLTEIRPWLTALDDALGNEGQLLMISHHPEVIDALAAERTLWFERANGGPVRVRSDVFSRDDGLRASEQLLRGLIDVE